MQEHNRKLPASSGLGSKRQLKPNGLFCPKPVQCIELEILKHQDWPTHSLNSFLWTSIKYGLNLEALIIELGADVTSLGNYAIKVAAEVGNLKAMKFLIDQGADVTCANGYCLRWAANQGHIHIVEFLLELGMDPNDDDGTPIEWARMAGNTDIVNLLVNKK